MFFEQIYEKGLAQASCMIGCQATGTAVVVDAKRDIDTYLEIAEREHLKITHLTETHIHADFLSGTRELARATGAEMLLSDEGGPDWQYKFPHTPVRDGTSIQIGKIRIDALHPPGHTPEHLSSLVTDGAAADYPVMILTGDFVFVGDVGRPDLLEKAAGIAGTQEIGARQLFESLARFKSLPEYTQVWPGHGAGSACGKALCAVPSSTVGYEKLTNWAFQHERLSTFAPDLLAGQPEPPMYFAALKHLNKVDRDVLESLPVAPVLSPDQTAESLASGYWVMDTRDRQAYGQSHIPGTVSIPVRDGFSTWAGWLLDFEAPIVLVASPREVDYYVRALVRIGMDRGAGHLPDINLWRESGRPLESVVTIDATRLESELVDEAVRLEEVRGETEYQGAHIPGARNVHVGALKDSPEIVGGTDPLVLQCATGDRATMAYSILEKAGRPNVRILAGGLAAWRKACFAISSAA